MAYVDSAQTDPNQQQTAQGNPGANNAQAPSTSSGSVANAPVQAQGQGVAAQPTASKAPQFQNLGAYLNANAPQTAQMGQNVAQNLQQTGQQTQSAIDQAQNQFNSAVQAGSTSLDQNLLNQATSNPTDFVKDPNNVNTFQGYLNAQYKGPTDFSQAGGYGDVASQVQNATQQGANVSAPGGLQQLISGQERNPTAGTQNLDALLLRQSPDAQNAITTAAKPLAGLGDYFTNVTNAANTGATNAAAATAAIPGQVTSAFAPVTSQFQQGLTTAQQTAEAQRQAYNNQLQTLQNQSSPLSADLQALLASLGSTDLSNVSDPYKTVLGTNPYSTAATPENTATPDQFAEDAAFQQLLGSGYNTALNPALANQASTFKTPGQLNYDPVALAYDAYNNANTAIGDWAPAGSPYTPVQAAQHRNVIEPAFEQLMKGLEQSSGKNNDDFIKQWQALQGK